MQRIVTIVVMIMALLFGIAALLIPPHLTFVPVSMAVLMFSAAGLLLLSLVSTTKVTEVPVILFILCIAASSCTVEHNRVRTKDKVIIDGDEIPGMSATQDHPDSCLAYYDNRLDRIVIRYIH